MARKNETRTIDGVEFTVSQHPPRRWYRLRARLLRLLGPSIVALKGDDDVLAALGSLLATLDLQELDSLQLEILSCTSAVMEGKSVPLDNERIIDAVFDGRPEALDKVLLFSLEVNYRDFFEGVVGKLRGLGVLGSGSLFGSPNTSESSGPSGGSG